MVTEEQIKELAYSLWEQECYPEGSHSEHYFRAKQILEEREANPQSAKEPVPPASTLQLPSMSKPVQRHTGKRRSKKA